MESVVDQEGWKAICISFFRDGDKAAQEAVACFDRSQANAQASVPVDEDNSVHIRLEIDEVPPDTHSTLDSVGMTNPRGLSTIDLLACVATKNAARREVHILLEKARRAKLSKLLAQHGVSTPGAASQSRYGDVTLEAPLSTLIAADTMARALQHFARTYSDNPGVRPFIRGIVELIKQQRGCPTVVRWVLPTEAFTERVYPTFMDDAVVLMCGFFRYVSPSSEIEYEVNRPAVGSDNRQSAEGGHGWDVEHSLSDQQLAGMLSTLRSAAATSLNGDVRPSGYLIVTDLPRTNQDGGYDEPGNSICPACAIL